MAKRSRTGDEDSPGLAGRLAQRFRVIGARFTVRQWVMFTTVVTAAWGARWGLGRLEQTVRAMPAVAPKPRILLVDVPDWVKQEGWLDRYRSLATMAPGDHWIDPDLPSRIAERFRASGWVKEVNWVRKEGDGSIYVRCEFRRPIGMVRSADGYLPVDADCVRLPEVYEQVSPGWITIEGAQQTPPPIGARWSGKDLQAGVRLAALIFERPLATQIASIDVSNYGGRDPTRQRITLQTQGGMHIRWGSAPGEEIYEPTAIEKIRNIEHVLEVDPSLKWIDVSVFQNRIVAPKSNAPALRVVKNPIGSP